MALYIYQALLSIRRSNAGQTLFRNIPLFFLSIKLKLLENTDLAGQMQEKPPPAKWHTSHWALVTVLRNIAWNLQVK
jgi:hypothetical protein